MKRLRPFVTFSYDLRGKLEKSLSRSQKAEITRYYNQLARALFGQYIIYRPKTRENINKARRISGMTLPKFRAFVIPSPTGAGRVKWRGEEVVIEKEGGFVRTIYPNQRLLATNPRAYLTAILRDDRFYIVNSKHDWRGGGTKEAVIRKLEDAMSRYGWGKTEEDYLIERGRSSNDRDEEEDEPEKEVFTITIVEVDLRNQKSFLDYMQSRREKEKDENETARKTRVRERSRKRRQRGARRK